MTDDKHPISAVLESLGIQWQHRHGWQLILCPVHDESRPSGSVNIEENAFNCFACQAKGDTYDLIRLIAERAGETIDFKTARIRAAALSGVSDSDLSGGTGRFTASGRVPRGTGYQPRYRNKVPPRLRPRGA